jgi:hypothetical protein
MNGYSVQRLTAARAALEAFFKLAMKSAGSGAAIGGGLDRLGPLNQTPALRRFAR